MSPTQEELQQVVAGTPLIEAPTVSIICFTLGVGVLRIDGLLNGSAHDACTRYSSERERMKATYSTVIAAACEKYIQVLTADSTEHVARFEHVDRTQYVGEAAALYPVFFSQRVSKDLRGEVMFGTTDQPTTTYEEANISVGWAESCVDTYSDAAHKRIVEVFRIAIASWYALYLMNRLMTFHFVDAFVELTDSRTAKKKKATRAIRMAYLEAGSAWSPIHWTKYGRDLQLLTTIHEVWRSKELREDVERRTEVLALHYQGLEAEDAKRHEDKLFWMTLSVGLFALVSVVADVVSLAKAPTDRGSVLGLAGVIADHGFLIAIIVFGLLLVFFLRVVVKINSKCVRRALMSRCWRTPETCVWLEATFVKGAAVRILFGELAGIKQTVSEFGHAKFEADRPG